MTTIPPTNLKPKTKSQGKAKSSTLANPPRLEVPTISICDKTPTPTKLLRAADELGLFQDVELNRGIIAQG